MGVDVGSVSTNVAVLDSDLNLVHKLYIRTMGHPIEATKRAIKETGDNLPPGVDIKSVGTTGSARTLTKVMLGADIAKTEITAHAVASSFFLPNVKTILEIGGQDSKVIILEDGLITDFGMNTVCAAGTGSFLDHQARRLGIEIEDFGDLALQSRSELNIAGRCTVFAESDMIHKQQTGHPMSEILRGLCDALVRNYMNNICKGKKLLPPVMFQGGVAANVGMKKAFEDVLEVEAHIPEYFDVMGAIGVAILAKEDFDKNGHTKSSFYGFDMADFAFDTTSFECEGCSNECEVIQVYMNKDMIARWGGRCGKWEM
jgi:predicted CoA-substrate-specific enzyme activase